MNKHSHATQGLKLMVEKCRDDFRLPENIDFYRDDDYKKAERKYVKFCLHGSTES